ncbi:MAG: V-type ATP synthase subunit B [Candidatus Micrarchaeia archaeon]
MKFEKEFKTVSSVAGPLVIVKSVPDAAYNEIVKIKLENGDERLGQVLETTDTYAVIEVFGDTSGINVTQTSVRFAAETFKLGVSEEMLGRIFDGQGRPADIKAEPIAEEFRDINGSPLNPTARLMPNDFIQTGISSIDGLITLVRGQKLPIFSGSGLGHNELAAQITMQAKTKGESNFVVIFGGIGITHDDELYFIENFRKTGALKRTIAFINNADDPSVERILTPRLALTTAEYFAYELGKDVLVILTDMTNYCEALRELSSAREEVPGTRGYPGYMYTDLASIYERAGIVKGRKGSITQLSILTMPGDDITHPIPDLTGYITEGQIYLSRDLANKKIYPPINPLSSLSRLMNNGIGEGKTEPYHRQLADQLYGAYAKANDARNLSSIVGPDALSDIDKKYMKFGELFESKFLSQGQYENRSIEQTLDLGWELLSTLPETELTRIKSEYIKKYYKYKA